MVMRGREGWLGAGRRVMVAHLLIRSALAFTTHSCLPCRHTNTNMLKLSQQGRNVATTKCMHATMVERNDVDEAAQTLRRIGASACTSIFVLSSFTVAPSLAQPGMAGYVASDLSELAPVSKDGKPGPILLVPLLQAQRLLQDVDAKRCADSVRRLQSAKRSRSGSVKRTLCACQGDEETLQPVQVQDQDTGAIALLKIVVFVSDNIYITDPSRKNMYLDGSAMLGLGPSTFGFGTLAGEQYRRTERRLHTCDVLLRGSEAVLLRGDVHRYRNEALDNLDALQAELKFVLKQVTEGGCGCIECLAVLGCER
eukprot:767182-Hanusia_phi.AAC.2